MTQFWELSSPVSLRGRVEWEDDAMDVEVVTCPIKEGHRHTGRRLTDLSVVLPNRRTQDFVWTWYSELMIQDHVLKLFREQNITGFEVKPVTARFKKPADDPPPPLWEVVVTGWAGMAPPETGIKLLQYCPGCRLTKYSPPTHPEHLVNPDQWDGSDFFIVWPLPGFIMISERAKTIIEKAMLTGARIVPLKDLEFSGGTLGPGDLSDYMPEQRAREIEKQWGIY